MWCGKQGNGAEFLATESIGDWSMADCGDVVDDDDDNEQVTSVRV